MESGLIQQVQIIVNQSPFCFWDIDVAKSNSEFIEAIDPEYYDHISKQGVEGLSSEKKHYFALSLRSNYYHSLETMFAFICATVQSPRYVIGWMQKYSNEDLRQLIENIDKGSDGVRNAFGKERLSWEEISRIILPFKLADTVQDQTFHNHQKAVLEKFAKDFLDSNNVAEYNSIKHGLRTTFGGFSLSFGLEEKPGEAAPPDKMEKLSGSDYGSKFYIIKRMSDGNKVNLKVKNHHINWNPISLSKKIHLVSKTIRNTLLTMKLLNGIEVQEPTFEILNVEEGSLTAWMDGIQINNVSYGIDVSVDEKHYMTKEAIIKKYDEQVKSFVEGLKV
jgi:hypothetical protein